MAVVLETVISVYDGVSGDAKPTGVKPGSLFYERDTGDTYKTDDGTTWGRTVQGVDVVASLPAGTAIVGKVGIDQTTPGTTNRVIAHGLPVVYNATGAAALALSTTMASHFRLKEVTVHFNTAPTTAGNLTLTLNATDGAAYDTVIRKRDPAADGATDYSFEFEGDGLLCENGDEIDVAYANADARTYGVRIVCEAV